VLLEHVDDALVGDDPDVVVVLVPVEEQAYGAYEQPERGDDPEEDAVSSRTPMASNAQAATMTGTAAISRRRIL